MAIGRSPATIHRWYRANLLTAHGDRHRRRWSLRELAAQDDRIRSRHVAGHHNRLRKVLADMPTVVVDDIVDRPTDYALSVVTTDPAADHSRRAG